MSMVRALYASGASHVLTNVNEILSICEPSATNTPPTKQSSSTSSPSTALSSLPPRSASITRETKETRIKTTVCLDGSGKYVVVPHFPKVPLKCNAEKILKGPREPENGLKVALKNRNCTHKITKNRRKKRRKSFTTAILTCRDDFSKTFASFV